MRLGASLLLLGAALPGSLCDGKTYAGRVADGTVGLGLSMYDPTCAYMCRNSAAGFMLDCQDDEDSGHAGHHRRGVPRGLENRQHGHHVMPSPDCYATNEPFLQTLAWCIHTKCPESLGVAEIETFWANNAAGYIANPPTPSLTFQEALARINEEPAAVADPMVPLNDTSLVDEWLYEANWGANWGIRENMTINNHYTLVLILSCSLIPILFSLLRFVPFPVPKPWVAKFYAHIVDPPAFGSHHAVPVLLGLGVIPTRGQALFIAYIWIVNILLCSVSYVVTWPNLWYTQMNHLIMCSVANRTGMLSFANLALAVLFSSRNNVLLWVTNWSRQTFVLVHRWIAVICVIQGFLHSVLYLAYQADLGGGLLEAEARLPYYYWGIIAWVVMTLIVPASVLPLRRKLYEAFLASHVVLAILTLIGCFLHIYFRYHWQWGYEIWTALAFAIWGFDHFLARPARLLRSGIKRARVEVVDNDYLKLEVPGVTTTGHAYLYFPTIGWRVWENHPFSVIPTGTHRYNPELGLHLPTASIGSDTEEKRTTNLTTVTTNPHEQDNMSNPGIVFFMRRRGGLTHSLSRIAVEATRIPVLIEPYGSGLSPLSSPGLHSNFEHSNLIVIAGGVGITGVLPLLDHGPLAARGSIKLFWGVRTEPLVQAVTSSLGQSSLTKTGENTATGVWGIAQVFISIGRRFDLRDVLEREILNPNHTGSRVVVCGPAAMSDEVRLIVCDLAKQGGIVRFHEERFGW